MNNWINDDKKFDDFVEDDKKFDDIVDDDKKFDDIVDDDYIKFDEIIDDDDKILDDINDYDDKRCDDIIDNDDKKLNDIIDIYIHWYWWNQIEDDNDDHDDHDDHDDYDDYDYQRKNMSIPTTKNSLNSYWKCRLIRLNLILTSCYLFDHTFRDIFDLHTTNRLEVIQSFQNYFCILTMFSMF